MDSLIRPTNPNHRAKNIKSVIQAVIINTTDVRWGFLGQTAWNEMSVKLVKGNAHVKKWLRQKQTSMLNT